MSDPKLVYSLEIRLLDLEKKGFRSFVFIDPPAGD